LATTFFQESKRLPFSGIHAIRLVQL